MQQPGLQQTPAGWPGMPGLQSPPAGQGSQFQPGSGPFRPNPFQPGQVTQPGAFPFPQSLPQQQVPTPQFPSQGYPGQSYQMQPYPNPYQPSPQPGGPSYQTQTMYQAQAAPQPQAAPVPPVAFPTVSPPSQGGGQQGPQSQAQALSRQLVELARTLEQLIPGYQIMQSILLELTVAPSGQPITWRDETLRSLKDALYYHGATLGAIRRLLCGETTPAVLTNLAMAFQALSQVQTEARPLLERLIMVAPLPIRSAISSLTQSVTAADTLLGQAGAAIQALVGPQIWETARTRIQEKTIRKAESDRNES